MFNLTEHLRLNKKMRFGDGFTLIELLVVIAIISLLSSITIVNLNQIRLKARDARRTSDLKEISLAINLYQADHGVNPFAPASAPMTSTCTPGFVGDICWLPLLAPYFSSAGTPVDPINKQVCVNSVCTWRDYRYIYDADGHLCHGSGPTDWNAGPNPARAGWAYLYTNRSESTRTDHGENPNCWLFSTIFNADGGYIYIFRAP